MKNLTEPLRSLASNLLAEGQVDLVLGFERGSLPLRSRPFFARQSEQARRLVCDAFSESNLARYLCDLRGQRVAILARGCESRSIATLLAERQIDRREITILGVPCQGVIDRRLVESAVPGEILAAEDEGTEIVLYGRDFERRLVRAEFLCRACQACAAPNPDPVDLLIGEPVPERPAGRDLVAEFEALSPAERWAHFAAETSRCIRCYACRQACPLCYCPECFVDHPQPHWSDSGVAPAGQQFWHVMRAYHQAGRCARCGACERACPLGIHLVHLTDKLDRIVQEQGLVSFRQGVEG